jgi:hypothetical protein
MKEKLNTILWISVIVMIVVIGILAIIGEIQLVNPIIRLQRNINKSYVFNSVGDFIVFSITMIALMNVTIAIFRKKKIND